MYCECIQNLFISLPITTIGNSLEPEHAEHFVRPELGPNCWRIYIQNVTFNSLTTTCTTTTTTPPPPTKTTTTTTTTTTRLHHFPIFFIIFFIIIIIIFFLFIFIFNVKVCISQSVVSVILQSLTSGASLLMLPRCRLLMSGSRRTRCVSMTTKKE